MDLKIKIQKRAERRTRRRAKVRQIIEGTGSRPRLTIYRSLAHIYAQIVDDAAGKTLAYAGSNGKGVAAQIKGMKKSDVSKFVGQLIAKRALENNISNVVFDRNGYQYHGRVKAVAEAAREAGLKF